jgi:hypothetical protein
VGSFKTLKRLIPKEKSNGSSFSCNNVDTNFDSGGSPTFAWELQEDFNAAPQILIRVIFCL